MDNARLLAAIVEQFKLMQQRVDARFDEERASVAQQFDLVQRRFEEIDLRFEQIDARFDAVYARFEQIDARFEQIDARFEQIDARFEQIDARYEQIDARFDRERATVAGQFEFFQKRMDQRFDELAEALQVLIGSSVSGRTRPSEGG
jgi:uncharacterized protein (DUF3084 family)